MARGKRLRANDVTGMSLLALVAALGCSSGAPANPADPDDASGGSGARGGSGGAGKGGSPASGKGGSPASGKGGASASGGAGSPGGGGGATAGQGGAGDPVSPDAGAGGQPGAGGGPAVDMGAAGGEPGGSGGAAGNGSPGAGGNAAGGSSGSTDPSSPPAPPAPPPGFTLRWTGNAATTGPGAFEGTETAECTHAGTQHFGVAGGNYRVDMHFPADTDCKAGDRQRNEVKGMRTPEGGYISMKQNETWLITYAMFIPPTLNATTGFTHIHQIFAVEGTMATVGPVVTMSLHSHEGTDSIEMRIDGTSGPHWSPVPLAPIQNRWVTVEFEVKWASAGTFRWTIKDGDRVHVNATRTWNGWHGSERMRPKWGIYRKRDSAGLQNTYILLNNYRAYQKD